jgi:FKBP-type peptidyl-prolyl cis-trans isomerase FklB
MQRLAICAGLVLLLTTPLMAQKNEPIDKPAAEKPPTATKADKSYAIGINIGTNIKKDDLDIDLKEVLAGVTDGISGKKSRLTDEQLQTAMQALQYEIQQRAIAKFEKIKKDGEAFLAANAKKPGVTETASGLQYKVIKSGKGASPKRTDRVSTHYHGTLLDGTVFDSSVERGKPVTFPVNRVIPGWTEALLKMKVGDKWQLFVPPDLAYGEAGTDDGAIGPNSVLVFEVELLGIEEPAETPPPTKKSP